MTPVKGAIPVSREQYEALVKLNAAFEKWRGDRQSWKEVPAEVNITNEQRAQIEVYEFVHHPPEKYFLYCSFKREKGQLNEATHYGASGTAITWTGEKLGDVQCGRTWRGNMGDTRVSIRVYAINGKVYAGTYYKSSGNYARVKVVKE